MIIFAENTISMSKKKITERRRKWLNYKKEDPLGMKVRFVENFVFSKFRSSANATLNNCGWQFEENDNMHKLWRLYHCDLEEMYRIYHTKVNKYSIAHNRDMTPTDELLGIFSWYLTRAYELFKRSLQYTSMMPNEREYYENWFKKNLKKLK